MSRREAALVLAGYMLFTIYEQSIEFTKKNQSVTYLVFANEDAALVGYFTLAIKPISVNAENFSNTMKRKIARVSELDEENGLPGNFVRRLRDFTGALKEDFLITIS